MGRQRHVPSTSEGSLTTMTHRIANRILVLCLGAATVTGACNAADQVPAADLARTAPALPMPGPFPIPYASATIATDSPQQRDFVDYLKTTPLFPDEAACTDELLRRLDGKVKENTVRIDWVTPPFLAWGGQRGKVVVGALETLYAITEAHVTAEKADGPELKLTYSCYVQYARFPDTDIWRAKHVRYGAYIKTGHEKYITGPAVMFMHAAPGKASKWEAQIRYYRE
jgi:hypothetical protein